MQKVPYIKLEIIFVFKHDFAGLYLYLLVVQTFTGDNIKLRLCLVIGWGMFTLF